MNSCHEELGNGLLREAIFLSLPHFQNCNGFRIAKKIEDNGAIAYFVLVDHWNPAFAMVNFHPEKTIITGLSKKNYTKKLHKVVFSRVNLTPIKRLLIFNH